MVRLAISLDNIDRAIEGIAGYSAFTALIGDCERKLAVHEAILSGLPDTNSMEAYISENFGEIADELAIRARDKRIFEREESLDPLKMISIWRRVSGSMKNIYGLYGMARVIACVYSVGGLEISTGDVANNFPRYFIESREGGRLPPEIKRDDTVLRSLEQRLGYLVDNLVDLTACIPGLDMDRETRKEIVNKAIRENDPVANERLGTMLRTEKQYPLVLQVCENFGNGLHPILQCVGDALDALGE